MAGAAPLTGLRAPIHHRRAAMLACEKMDRGRASSTMEGVRRTAAYGARTYWIEVGGDGAMVRNASWAPTIALSWLWGLGFFFSFNITLNNGWLGFLAFALPNAFGLLAFGWILGAPGIDPTAVFEAVRKRYVGFFLTSQILAVAITIFASVAYLFLPIFGVASIPIVAVFVILSTAVGHSASMRGLKHLHIVYLAVGIAAAATLLAILSRTSPSRPVPFAAFDGRFYGLVLPSLAGFLFGPWTDVQHWQRAVAIHAEGGSVRRAYVWGGLLFFCLIALNASLAAAAGPLAIVTMDGLKGYQAAVAFAVIKAGGGVAAVAYVIWAGAAIASTLDSFYFATKWLMRSTLEGNTNPLLTAVPTGLMTSPLWYLVTAVLVACLAIGLNVPMIALMIPYATLLVGSAACLVCEAVGGRPSHDAVQCTMIGTASLVLFLTGYFENAPLLMGLSPLVGLVGAVPAARALLVARSQSAAVFEPDSLGALQPIDR